MQVNQKLFESLTGIFQQKQPVLEILSVYHGLKKSCRLSVNENQIKLLQQVLEDFLCICVQDYKINFIKDEGKGGFANKTEQVPLGHAQGEFIVYLAKRKKEALLAKECEKLESDKNLGKVLGYPPCCVDFFAKNKENQSHEQMDFIVQACKGLGPFSFVNNYCLRYFDISLLCHFPCCFDCQESKSQGEAALGLIKCYSSQWALNNERALKSFVLYTEYNGVFYCPDYDFENDIISYKRNIFGTQKNWIIELLGKNNKIECVDHKKFKVGDRLFNDGEMVVMFK